MAGSEVFVGTGLWIAATREPDAQHERAKVLSRQLLQRRAKPVISDLVLAEVVTFILRKDGHEVAEKVMDRLQNNATTLFVDKVVLEEAVALLRQYWGPRKKLSVCDATSCILMRNRSIEDLYSFDSGFDGIPGVNRIA